MKRIGSLSLLAAVLLFQAPFEINGDLNFKQFHTTFRILKKSNVRPTTIHEMNDSNKPDMDFVPFEDNYAGCPEDPSNARFAGYRYAQAAAKNDGPLGMENGKPNMIIIFDAAGKMAGTQSLVPSDSFVGWDCLENEYYTKENITDLITGDTTEFCVTTMYFKDPSSICNKDLVDSAKDALYLQKKDSFKPENLLHFPETYDEAKNDQVNWHIDHYFLGMGHHITPNTHGSNDCKSIAPVQGLYAEEFGVGCHNQGFVWQHYNTKVEDVRMGKKGDEWEAPPTFAVKQILRNPAQCLLDASDKKLAKTMHVFLGGYTKKCCFFGDCL